MALIRDVAGLQKQVKQKRGKSASFLPYSGVICSGCVVDYPEGKKISRRPPVSSVLCVSSGVEVPPARWVLLPPMIAGDPVSIDGQRSGIDRGASLFAPHRVFCSGCVVGYPGRKDKPCGLLCSSCVGPLRRLICGVEVPRLDGGRCLP